MRRGITPLLVAFLLAILVPAGTHAQTRYLGSVALVSFDYAPKGWALCNGQLLPINQNRPYLRFWEHSTEEMELAPLRCLICKDACQSAPDKAQDLSSYSAGETGGEETQTLTSVRDAGAYSHSHRQRLTREHRICSRNLLGYSPPIAL